jgi:squalene monooxygenase
MNSFDSLDVFVIGAGPVGCVTALCYAQQGARVLLLEAYSQAAKRFAGEWLHPPAVKILQQLGIDLHFKEMHYPTGKGFVVFPEDGTAPIQLHYPDGEVGFSCEHHVLLTRLREAVIAQRNIQFLDHARVIHIEQQQITFAKRGSERIHTASVPLIVGADGRGSWVRKRLGISVANTPISYMAGILLKDVEMPFEGFGHVILGGVGPVLMYRIGANSVRLCLDVPAAVSRDVMTLWTGYHSVLPPAFHSALQQALERNEINWVTNQFCPRIYYGRSGLALVGDATGFFHPLTAAGMTIGFLDSTCLLHSQRFGDYQKARFWGSYVPELLATVLYNVFAQQDESAAALRQAIYHMWREDSGECHRTMQLLSGVKTNVLVFSVSFLKGLLLAVQDIVYCKVRQGQWNQTLPALKAFSQWLTMPFQLILRRSQTAVHLQESSKLALRRKQCLEN